MSYIRNIKEYRNCHKDDGKPQGHVKQSTSPGDINSRQGLHDCSSEEMIFYLGSHVVSYNMLERDTYPRSLNQ